MRGKPVGKTCPKEESATVNIQVLPRASRAGVAGLLGDAVRIRLTAPPLENRANEALVRFLSASLDVPRPSVEIIAGTRGRKKIVRVAGISRGELFRRLGLAQPPG
ncbi:MAG: DUF167 domain-containing protein [Candidatus Deferrimicrobiaceae bacterium]